MKKEKNTVGVTFPPELKAEIERCARKTYRTQGSFVRWCVQRTIALDPELHDQAEVA